MGIRYFLPIDHTSKLIAAISAHKPFSEIFQQRFADVHQHIISYFFSIHTVDPFEILNISHYKSKILIISVTDQRLYMMEKCLFGIKPCKIIKFYY